MIHYNRPKIVGPVKFSAFEIQPTIGFDSDGIYNNARPMPPKRKQDEPFLLGSFEHTALKSNPCFRPLNVKKPHQGVTSLGALPSLTSGKICKHFTANHTDRDFTFDPCVPLNKPMAPRADLNFAGMNSSINNGL